MAKEAGFAATISVDDNGGTARAISNDIMSYEMSTPRGEYDITGVDKSARERLLGLADFSVTFTGAFNDASAPSSHDTFKTVPSTSVARTTSVALSGQTLACEAFFTDYALSRAADGGITFSAPGALSGGAVPTWS